MHFTDTARTLAERMHKIRCKVCNGVRALDECNQKTHWTEYAERCMKHQAKTLKGKFVKGKPKDLVNLERRMEMGAAAKEVKLAVEEYIKGLIDDNLTLEQVSDLYNKMQALSTLNRKYKRTVCKKRNKHDEELDI